MAVCGGLLLTYSRGAYIAFGTSAIAAIILLKQWKWLSLFPVAAVILFLLPRPGGEGINLLRTISVVGRLENNQAAVQLFLRSPVIGYGFDTIRYIRADSVNSLNGLLSNASAGFQNSYLFILVTTGIIGLIAYGLLWWRLFISGLENVKKSESKLTRLILTTSFVAVATHAFFDNSLFYTYVMMWLWVLFGSFSIESGSKRE